MKTAQLSTFSWRTEQAMLSPLLFHPRDNIESERKGWYEAAAAGRSVDCAEYISLQSARGHLDPSGVYLIVPAVSADDELAAEVALFQHAASESFFAFELSLTD